MGIRARLTRLLGVILDETARNPEFAARLDEVLNGPAATRATRKPTRGTQAARRGGRRAAALVDPVAVAQQGETPLRKALAPLELERLLDIVAEHGMDPGKLVMKWKDRERVIDRIVDIASARSTKGDAFRSG